MTDQLAPIISLRKLSRVAPELTESVIVVHDSRVIGDYHPRAIATPRPAQDGKADSGKPPASTVSGTSSPGAPARTGASRTRAASGKRSEPAPGGAPKAGMTQAERDEVLRRVNRAGSER
jgi:hypothetical protein